MAAAVFFLLLAIWMEELSLIFRVTSVIGVGLLCAAAWTLWEHYRAIQAQANPVAALTALRRLSVANRWKPPIKHRQSHVVVR